MSINSGDKFLAGVITTTHGLRGEVKIRPEDFSTAALCNAVCYDLHLTDGTTTEVKVRSAVPHKHALRVLFAGCDHISCAQGYVRAKVWIDPHELPELEAGEYYWHQLRGLTVVDRTHGELGRVNDMLMSAAHPVYVVDGADGEVLIPAVDAMVERVDLDAGVMYVNLPQGLVELN